MPLKIAVSDFDAFRLDAIRAQGQELFMRDETPQHLAFLRDASRATGPDEEFRKLLQNVFSHHEIFLFKRINRKEVKYDLLSDISRVFHTEYFTPVRLKRGYASDNQILDQDAFFERITAQQGGARENNIQFLVGNIGDGKTTFICNLIFKNWIRFLKLGIIPVRFNIDTLSEHSFAGVAGFAAAIYGQLLQSLRLNNVFRPQDIDALRDNTRIVQSDDAQHVLSRLASIIKLIKQKHKVGLLFIVDNIDFLYHIGDRGAFSREPHEEQRKAYEAIIALVRIFARDDQLCANLGLNILYCLRHDTLEYIMSKRPEVPFVDIADRCASLESNSRSVEKTLEIVESRFELLVDLAQDIPEEGKKEAFIAQATELRNHYRVPGPRGNRLFTHLWHLSRRGLRDVIEQLSKYSWIESGAEHKVELNFRFHEQYSPGMLAYVLGGRRRYHQFTGSVPNLYLINATAKSDEFAVPPEFKAPHFSTFWLKRMILHYLDAKEDEHISSEDVVETFSGRHGRAYPEALVRYTLGTLAHVPFSECIEAEIGADGGGDRFYVKRIHLTQRGRFLVRHFADSFAYLQLVVDDWRLRLPRDLKPDFQYFEPDYKYLVSDATEYLSQVKIVLERKARQTLGFALLLEEHLELEKKVWPNVFKRLQRTGVRIPRSGHIVTQLVDSIDRVTKESQSRAMAYGYYCSDKFLGEQRIRIRAAVEKVGMPHLTLLHACYDE